MLSGCDQKVDRVQRRRADSDQDIAVVVQPRFSPLYRARGAPERIDHRGSHH
jgi:hypothetical protein